MTTFPEKDNDFSHKSIWTSMNRISEMVFGSKDRKQRKLERFKRLSGEGSLALQAKHRAQWEEDQRMSDIE